MSRWRSELDDVRFGYPSADEVSLASAGAGRLVPDRRGGAEEVLHGDRPCGRCPVSLLVALVGPSGAGKSTDHQRWSPGCTTPPPARSGSNGLDLREVSFESLHDTVGVVTQDAHLFHDTIRANLSLCRGRTASEEQMVRRATGRRRSWDLISRPCPEGLDTVVGDRGHRLSGGEKQRMALARLLLKAPGLVVLDEATAHLDSESEAAVQRALDRALDGRTALVIAHRLSTVRAADQIVVVDGGRVVQRGTHDQLIARGGLYADLYRTQFAGQATASA